MRRYILGIVRIAFLYWYLLALFCHAKRLNEGDRNFQKGDHIFLVHFGGGGGQFLCESSLPIASVSTLPALEWYYMRL